MLQDQDHFDVDAAFEHGLSRAPELWARLGEQPDFQGKDVLEIGSGLGFLSAQIARMGARSVVGVEIWQARVDYSTRKVAERFPDLDGRVRFTTTPTEQIEGAARFDVIISENTFEHISDIDPVVASFHRLLRPDGRVYLGFSPLYHSPFGDHGELRAPVRLPWLHLLAGRGRVIAAFNKANGEAVTTLPQCGYNGLRPVDFKRAFARSGLTVERLRLNPTEGRLKRAAMAGFAALAKVPALEPFFTVGIYATLRQPLPN